MLLIRLENITRADENGSRIVQFELNGMPREIRVHDNHVKILPLKSKANPDIPENRCTFGKFVDFWLVKNGNKEPIV